MSVKLLLGPAGSGKTERCLQEIMARKRLEPRATIWVVLPNRAQVVAFRRRFARAGGGLGVRIETMVAFVEELAVRLACQRPRASAPVRLRLVQTALRELADEGTLPHLASIAATAGLSHLFSDRFLELKRAGWQAKGLLPELAQADEPLPELAAVFQRYQDHLEALGWEDVAGLSQQVSAALLNDPAALADLALVVIDGFDSFSANQRQLLANLAHREQELILTLPTRNEDPQEEFPRFQQSITELTGAIAEMEIAHCQRVETKSPDLSSLAQGLFTGKVISSEPAPGSIRWLKARSIRSEVQEALRWIKSAHIRQAVPLQSCALVLTEPDVYEPYVRETAYEYGIPLRMGMGRQLQRAPSMVALTDLLRLPLANWSRRLTLEAVRSPFFDLSEYGLEARAAVQLEAASYWGQVVEGAEQWIESLRALAQRDEARSLEQPEGVSAPLPTPAEASQLLKGLEGFVLRLEAGGRKNLADWVLWLEDLLQDFRFFERAQPKQEQEAALRLREVLRSMLLSEAVIGDRPQGYQDFLADLEGALERARYQPKIEWRESALQVEGIEAVRGLRFQAVAILGLAEGQLPVVEREDPFLSDEIRRQLGLEARIGRDQPALFYSAVSRADTSLLLTRPTLAEDGETWEPSPYWTESLRLFGHDDEWVPLQQTGTDRALAQAASEQEVAFMAVRRGSLPANYKSLEVRLQPLRKARAVIQARLAEVASGRFEGELTELSPQLEARFSPDYLWSPSRLESFGTCPHFYLTAQLLGLQQVEEPALGPDARQLGSLLHAILEQAYQRAQDPSNPELVLAELRSIAAAEFAKAPQSFGFRPSPLWEIEVEQFRLSLEETVLGLADEGPDWQPFGYEATFGLGEAPALEIESELGSIKVRGVIDRLDRKGDEVRVIDYKTGSSHLAASDLVRGRRLQLPLYALAAENALSQGKVTDGLYWAILSGKPGGLRLERFKADWQGQQLSGPTGAYKVLTDHLVSYLRAMRAGQFQPEPPHGGCPDYCPAANWCWRYSPGYQR